MKWPRRKGRRDVAATSVAGWGSIPSVVTREPVEMKLRSPEYLVVLVCTAQVFVQIGASFWPALLPGMMAHWHLSNSEAGWITAIFFGAYMVSVPVLEWLTDRFDARSVYLLGVALTVSGHLLFSAFAGGFWSALWSRALTGIGWAGTYMTGLKLLADNVEGRLMSRATAGHAASVGISGALSFACAELVAYLAGWRAAFLAAALSAAVAWLLTALAFPRASRLRTERTGQHMLFDFGRYFEPVGRQWRMRSPTAFTLSSFMRCVVGAWSFLPSLLGPLLLKIIFVSADCSDGSRSDRDADQRDGQ